MKKVMSAFLSLAMLVTMAVSVGAASPDETTDNEQIEVTPRYSFTNNTNTLISSKTVDDVKVICPYGSVTGYRGITTQIIIDLELQQLVDNEWTTIASWSQTFTGHRATLTEDMEVENGTYRTFATYTVFGGDECEIIGSSSLPYEFVNEP